MNECDGHWRRLGVNHHHVLLSLEHGRDCLLNYYLDWFGLVYTLFLKVHLKIVDRWVCLFADSFSSTECFFSFLMVSILSNALRFFLRFCISVLSFVFSNLGCTSYPLIPVSENENSS